MKNLYKSVVFYIVDYQRLKKPSEKVPFFGEFDRKFLLENFKISPRKLRSNYFWG